MPARKLFAIVALIPFTLLTALAVMQFGYVGIIENLLTNSAGWQALADLVIALLLVLAWMVPDARARGRNPWPWVVATLALGSFGPLLYLATERSSPA